MTNWVKYECQRGSDNPFKPHYAKFDSSLHKESFMRAYHTPVEDEKDV